ncbi:Quinol monooxygenase YgiN [Chitinophaga sp. CF118]|uniref:putative quinol monooxygenase n=1 Tax=Chitinophaga sp. CF118 TaxID=1884367 RepID=UPI0008E0483D|nr:putative quinol monooxygenase [Chitinophaga sp. CF118]SFF07798.1 Quinol monooxygenase YgiN [Chitinophaga sp. CF118]
MPVYLTAIVKVKPEFHNEMKAMLLALPVRSVKEEACIRYEVHQNVDDEDMFIFHELWENIEGLDKHNQQPYSQEFFASFEKLQEKPTVYISK